ncbi:MAG: flagellar basal body P-ring formation chaperone FlgA [Alphaproteobacteria bacterium]
MRWLLTLIFMLLLPAPAGADALTDATEMALRARGLEGRLLVTFTTPGTTAFGEAPEVVVNTLDPSTGRFTATVTLAVGDVSRQVRLGGRVDRMIEVPVPVRTIAAGRVIRESDLNWIELASGRLGNHAVTTAGAIVGHAAKRALRAGHPVSIRELTLPRVVRKGTLVTMVLSGPGLLLTATGRALENGADGETISLINIQSKRTVQGTVIGPNQVRIDDGRQVALR